MCRFCEYPFEQPNPLSRGYASDDYIGYGLDDDGYLCFIAFADFGYEGLDETWRVGPSTGLAACMFCGRSFSDDENYASSRDLDRAKTKKEGLYVVDFDNGAHIERPFLYSTSPEYGASEIEAFTDYAGDYEFISEANIVDERAYDEDGKEYDAHWLSTYDYGRLSSIKRDRAFYFPDVLFWA